MQFESYEIKNGMEKVWINIDDAMIHNAKVIDNLEPSMGLSIRRELFLLQTIKEKYFAGFK